MTVGVGVGMVVGVAVAVGMSIGAVIALQAVAMAVGADWCRVACVVENVLGKGGRDWRESVARALAKVALERRLHWRAYGRFWTSK